MQKLPPILFSLADQSFSRTKSIGIFNVSIGLAGALVEAGPERELIVFGADELTDHLPDARGRVRIIPFGNAANSRLGRMWYDQVAVYRAARRFPGAWLLLPKGFASFLLPPPRGIRLASYVHDAMQVHYRARYPRYFSRGESAYFWRGFMATLRHSEVILTNSQFTADEVEAFARTKGIRTGTVTRVGIGFSTGTTGHSPSDSRSGLVVLAGRVPHKLTSTAVKWLSAWQSRRGDFNETLHWVGSLPDGCRVDLFPNWRHHSRLDDAEYHRLMESARALVYFSEYEGFGMPPVEAVFRGVAPVYSDIPATREVMTGMGFSFSNESWDSFAAALDRSLKFDPTTVSGWRIRLEATSRWSDVARRVLEALG